MTAGNTITGLGKKGASAPSDPIQAAVDAVIGKIGEIITFIVPGDIVAWRRPQFRRLPNGGTAAYTHPVAASYSNLAKVTAKAAMGDRPPLGGPIDMTVVATFAVPSSWGKKRRKMALSGEIRKTSRPDLENLFKGVQDSIQGVVYQDDSQIVQMVAIKQYGHVEQLEIQIRPL